MYVLFGLVSNLWILLGNVRRLLGRAPDYVVIQVSGTLPELDPEVGLLQRLGLRGGQPPPSLEGIRSRLRRTSKDGRVRGVIFRVQGLDAGWAALEELRGEISRFRENGGGRVAVYLLEPDTRSYYMACAADEILAAPLSTVGVVGVGTRVSFLKDALDTVGVEAEVIAVSPYKSAGDTFTRNDFSPEAREQTERLVERRFESVVSAVSQGRSVTPEDARGLVDSAPYSAADALEAGLIDGALYEDELPEHLGGEEEASVVEWGSAQKRLRKPYRRMRRRRRVGVVRLSGMIVRGKSRRLPIPVPFVGGEQAGSETVIGALRRAEGDGSVAAVVFSVDSRGGDALASDLIWREVARTRRKKPVVVLMGEYAASGGYYVSAAANSILARRNTTTGSIGVVITRPVLARLYGKAGITPISVERGARAGLLDTSRQPEEDEISVLRDQLGGFYDAFKERVARGRDMPPEDVEPVAGGRVWTGEEALERGLVDGLGGLEDALEQARELSRLDEEAGWVKVKPPRSARPSPGRNVEEGVRETVQAARELKTTRAWAILPYEPREGEVEL